MPRLPARPPAHLPAPLPRHLRAHLLCALLGAASLGAQARELRPAEPLRVSLVSLARQASSSPTDPGVKLSVRRAWASDTQAQLCALTLDAQGLPVVEQGRYQLRRIQFERQQAAWRVQRVNTRWLAEGESLASACAQQGGAPSGPASDNAPTHLAKRPSADINVAIAEMVRNPPTAGLPSTRPAQCAGKASPDAMSAAQASDKPAGQIAPSGRSHLFTAPDTACPMGKHLVQNDKVRIGTASKGWTQVRYAHPITQVVTVGWLPSQKVKPATP